MIRQYRFDDAQHCCRIIHACLQLDHSISTSLRDKILASETLQSMDTRSRLFYLAVFESEAEIVGVAGLDMNEVRLLCVAPEHQRRGIGRTLLDHVAAMVPGYLFPDIFVYSAIPAVNFYKACGFIEKGQALFSFGTESLRTVFMSLPIRHQA